MKPANFHHETTNWMPHGAGMIKMELQTPRILGFGGRHYQKRRFKELKNCIRTLTKAPTGSGKGIMQIFDATREIIDSCYTQKQIFIVPQLNIGNGFTEFKHPRIKYGRTTYQWQISCNCCEDSEKSVSRIKEFMLGEISKCLFEQEKKVLGGVTAVVTYSAFIAAWRSMTDAEKRKALKNTSFRLDEVHHMEGVSEKEDAEDEEINQLGKFCKFALQANVEGTGIHLTTATFFRGNRRAIISEEYLQTFKIFSVPFMEHWEVLNLKELSHIYATYKNGSDLFNQVVNAVAEEPNQLPLIIVPSDGHGVFSKVGKSNWVKKLVKALEKIYGEGQVLDLVSPNTQKNHKERLVSEEQDFKAIVTCVIGREGSDWPPCSRIHNLHFDNSVLAVIQKLGRGLRAHEDKVDVKMFNYIEHFGKWDSSSEHIRKKLSDRFNAVQVASMLDEMICPILMPAMPKGDQKKKIKVTLEDLYGSERNNVVDQLMKEFLSIPKEDRSTESIDEAIAIVIDMFSENTLENVAEKDLVVRLRHELFRRLNPNPKNPQLSLLGINVDFVRKDGWDKVVREHIIPNSPFVGIATTKDLKQLQKYLEGDAWSENFEKVNQIGLKKINEDKEHPLHYFVKRTNAKVRYAEKMAN